jgi:uncharacterized protein YjcR
MRTTNRRETADKKQRAEEMIRAAQSVADVASQLSISANTVASWKRRYGWDVLDTAGKVKEALSEKLLGLIASDDGTAAHQALIDRYLGYMERAERIRQHPIAPLPLPEEEPLSPNPSPSRGEGNKKKRGRPKASERNVIDADQVQALFEEFERLCFAYQWEWWEARIHDGRVILKSRQIGATYYFAIEALIIAITTGKNQIFVSASKKQAAQFRRNIIRVVKRVLDIDLQGDPMRLILPDHPAGEVFLFFLGTQVSSVQGYSGDLYLDECGWVRNFKDIQEVASAMALQAVYRETYFTTPSSMDHDFYAFWTGTEYNRDRPKEDQISLDVSHDNLKHGKLCADGYWRQIVTIYDAIERGCNLFNIDKVKRKYSPARFSMLCLCQFIDHTASVFSFRQLQAALVNVAERWPDFSPLSARPLGNHPVWIGYDPSGEGEDAAAIVVVAPPSASNEHYRTVEVIRMDDEDYDEQAQQIVTLTKKYRVEYIGIDNQGVGDGVYQQIYKLFPSVTEAIRYSPESKASMVVKMLALLKRKLIEVDDVYLDEILPSMLAIQRGSTKHGGAMTYTARRSEDSGHADAAWAWMHALNKADFENLLGGEEGSGESLMEFF